MSTSTQYQKVLQLEKAAALFLTAILISLYAVMWFYAGGLWRDEVNTVNIAQMPFAELWEQRNFDSFPVLWLWIVKLWSAVAQTDFSLRALGFVMGLATVGAMWWAARAFNAATPFIGLFLLSTIPAAIQAGTSLRAYGCGMVLIISAAVCFWRMVETPSTKRIAASIIISVLAVQCLFQNAILLFALGCGALASAVYLRNKRIAVAVILSGITAGISLLPYYTYIFGNHWVHTIRSYPGWGHMLLRFIDTVGGAGYMMLWFGSIAALLLAVLHACRTRHSQMTVLIFTATTILSAVAGYALFLNAFGLYLQPWYFLPVIALCAVLVSVLTDVLTRPYLALRATIVALLAIMLALVSPALWQAAHVRWTNIDQVVNAVTPALDSNDLIMLNSAWEGITFKRYYHATTPWVSLPDLPDYTHVVHRGDLMKLKMQEEHPLADIHASIRQTLQSGHRVWLIGNFSFVQPGESAVTLPPAPNSRYGWYLPAYERYWSSTTAGFVQEHAQDLQLARPPDENVNPYENLPVFVAQGWRD